MDTTALLSSLNATLISVGWKLLGALLLWIGGMLIRFTMRLPGGGMRAVRPYCHHDHHWQVYFDTQQTIRDALGAAGFPAPEFVVEVNAAG